MHYLDIIYYKRVLMDLVNKNRSEIYQERANK